VLSGCGNNPQPAKSEARAGNATYSRDGRLPQDVMVSCTVTRDSFDTWFEGGKAVENGRIKPANSVTFPHTNNCSFYQWSEQMFLWITSPTAGGGTVLQSPLFYDVTPAVNKTRMLVPHKAGQPLRAIAHIDQTGPNRLPVIIDKQGRLYEVERHVRADNTKALLKSEAGKLVEVDHAETTADGTHIFKDKAGEVIPHPRAVIMHKVNQARIVQAIVTDKNEDVYLDNMGQEIQTETGQATNDALMAQNGSMVYYILSVNDVFAYYMTAVKQKEMNGAQFPTTAAERDRICAFARKNGATLPDSNALAVELKTSWVEAKGLADLGSYITADAVVPTYNTTDKCHWIVNGEKTVKLALIGMHVVGSLAGHPEMSWATFEHINNAPNAKYAYLDSTGKVKVVPQENGKGWLLSENAADDGYNISHMKVAGDTVSCTKVSRSISASNTLMVLPWGSAWDSVTNGEDKSSAASNSEVISINNAIRNMLQGKDVRKNYLLIGATWTDGGVAPNGRCYSITDTVAGVAIGTSVLANSTMETYFQKTTTSCLFCHSNNSLAPGALSHVFDDLKPLNLLPAAPASIKK